MRLPTPRTLPALLSLVLAAGGCAPNQDPSDPDQAPDLNYRVTDLKDLRHQRTIDAVDQEVEDRLVSRVLPGCAVAIIDRGRICYLKAYGTADFRSPRTLSDDVPFTRRTVVGIGSISKTITALAVMRLVEMGEVNLDANLGSYFDHGVPASWYGVTVRQALAHRAGFRRDPDDSFSGTLTPAEVDALFGEIHSSQHPRYAVYEFLFSANAVADPGQVGTYSYSNIGYTILGALIDNVTQDPAFGDHRGYERFVWSLLANRADDRALTACLDWSWRAGDIPNHAQGYSAQFAIDYNSYSGWQGASGGWSMTIGDLARFLLALSDSQMVSSSSLADMRTNPGTPPADPDDDYGLGLFVGDVDNRPAYHHGGVINGFRSQFIYWPEDQVGVVAFTNADRNGINAIAIAAANAYLDDRCQLGLGAASTPAPSVSPLAEISRQHYAAAEDAAISLVRQMGENAAATHLFQAVGAQGPEAQLLADNLFLGLGDLETNAALFLEVLDVDGFVGPYEPRRSPAAVPFERPERRGGVPRR